jgi:hypothetical protein
MKLFIKPFLHSPVTSDVNVNSEVHHIIITTLHVITSEGFQNADVGLISIQPDASKSLVIESSSIRPHILP